MALITIDELKSFLGISDDSEDTTLTYIVGAVDGLVKKYTGRDLEATDYTSELYDGTGQISLTLKQYPIISITTVYVDDDTEDAVTLAEREDGDTGYYYEDANSGVLYKNDLWPRGRHIIEITYRAGFETIPDDLKYACLRLGEYFRNMHGRTGVQSESLGSYGYSLAGGLGAIGGELTIPDVIVKNILDRYKRPEEIRAY